jgi:hypothetical protein
MTHPMTAGALAATACPTPAVPSGGSPLDVVAQILGQCADYLDSQANDLDPHGEAGDGKPWDWMQTARRLRDVRQQISKSAEVTRCNKT